MKYAFVIVVLMVAALAASEGSAVAQSSERCFSETGYCIEGRLRAFWERNGGLAVFGLPLSDQHFERTDAGTFEAQWFERERFELHPENPAPYDVLLGRLGAEALARQGRDWRAFPTGAPLESCLFFEQTQHTLCEPFLSFWRGNGLELDGRAGTSYDESLALFGLPLSEPAIERNSSGDEVLTQWFERARFEYHAERDLVLLGRLGAELYDPAVVVQYHAVQQPGWPHPLEVPSGFTIEEVANDLAGPRFIARDPADGSLLVPELWAGRLTRLRDTDGDNFYEQRQVVADGFDWMHSVAFVELPDGSRELYAGDEHRVLRLGDFAANGRAQRIETIVRLPHYRTDQYSHRTRTVAQGPDGKVYVSVGSSCDVCEEPSELRATILRMRTDGSDLEVYAAGLRNTVGFTWHPATGVLWGLDMGRNNIGAGLPPDELNRIEQGRNYGWPYCYGNNQPNPEFADPARCAGTTPPALNLPAHWSPLGIVFYDARAFPASYHGDAIVAFHGAGADQVERLSGYRVSRVRFTDGVPVGLEDLVRGWLVDGEVWGRPCGLLLLPDGSLLISDDHGGRIYRLRAVEAAAQP